MAGIDQAAAAEGSVGIGRVALDESNLEGIIRQWDGARGNRRGRGNPGVGGGSWSESEVVDGGGDFDYGVDTACVADWVLPADPLEGGADGHAWLDRGGAGGWNGTGGDGVYDGVGVGVEASGAVEEIASLEPVKAYMVEPDEGSGGPVYGEVMEDLGEGDPGEEDFYQRKKLVKRYRQGGGDGHTG